MFFKQKNPRVAGEHIALDGTGLGAFVGAGAALADKGSEGIIRLLGDAQRGRFLCYVLCCRAVGTGKAQHE